MNMKVLVPGCASFFFCMTEAQRCIFVALHVLIFTIFNTLLNKPDHTIMPPRQGLQEEALSAPQLIVKRRNTLLLSEIPQGWVAYAV